MIITWIIKERMEENPSKIRTKFRLLELEEEETSIVLEEKRKTQLTRQVDFYRKIINELYELKTFVKENKLEADEDINTIKQWNADLTHDIQGYERVYDKLLAALDEIDKDQQREGNSVAEAERTKRFEEELKLEKMKIKLRNEAEKQVEINTKLPNLTITPFKGTLLGWQRFWNQFTVEIDSKEMNSVTKMSYLRELVEPKVQILINGLPFTTEGYARAKSILQSKYGCSSEVANAHVQAILHMETVHVNNKHDVKRAQVL